MRGPAYTSLGHIPVDEVLPLLSPIEDKEARASFFGRNVKAGTLRLVTFRTCGTVCQRCGVVGTIFSLEKAAKDKTAGNYHLNLYAKVNDGLRLMTADHKIARSDGGIDRIENMQVLCTKCNSKKGSITCKLNDFFSRGHSLQSVQDGCIAI